jgi:hypothetical protein
VQEAHELKDMADKQRMVLEGLTPEQISDSKDPSEPVQVMDKREYLHMMKAREHATRPLRCVRCHQLKYYGIAGTGGNVTAEKFVSLLQERFMERGKKSCVIIKMVDLIDFHGSFIHDFHKVAGGRNPIILCANKFDALPKEAGPTRIQAWVKTEGKKYGLNFHSVHCVSARTGLGMKELFAKACMLARGRNREGAPRHRDIYLVGSTNVGKSTLINTWMQYDIISYDMI